MKTKLRYLDFFAGGGLVAEGLKGSFKVVWANDISEKKKAIFDANHQGVDFVLGDIKDVKGANLPAAEMAWASFPCQDLSLIGTQNGIGRQTRSGLVWQWIRVLKEMRALPKVVVAENVVGLIATSNGEHYKRIHNALAKLGYRVGAVVLDAKRWVPQSRPRVFIIGVKRGVAIKMFETEEDLWCHSDAIKSMAATVKAWHHWKLPEPKPTSKKLDDILEPDAPFDKGKKGTHNLSLISKEHRKRITRELRKFPDKAFAGYKRMRDGDQLLEVRFDSIAGCLRTLRGGSSHQFIIQRRPNGRLGSRLLTPREAARLMGARDGYKLPGTSNDGYRAMGDAVAVPAARHLAKHLLAPLCAKKKPKRKKAQGRRR